MTAQLIQPQVIDQFHRVPLEAKLYQFQEQVHFLQVVQAVEQLRIHLVYLLQTEVMEESGQITP